MTHQQITLARPGRLSPALMTFLGSGVVLVTLVAVLAGWNPLQWVGQDEQPTLVVYCAAGVKRPVEEAAREYEQNHGVKIQIQYGGSQTLLTSLEVVRKGDLYLPGDDSYLHLAREKELVEEVLPLARMAPVLTFRQDSKKKVASLEELLKSDLRISFANPEAAAVGKLVKKALGEKWPAFSKHIAVTKPTVNEVANDVVVGSVDAGVVWNATVEQYPELQAAPLPELEGAGAHIAVGVLRSSENPTAALRFARYLAARDRGLLLFEKHGFDSTEGDAWAEEPTITIYAGAMLHPAIDQTITEFEKREGVKVTRVYKGCGLLLNLMKTRMPDAYFSCDTSFMDQVEGSFPQQITLTSNPMVILVAKGNPRQIETLEDLLEPGLRVGVCNPEFSALGALTHALLQAEGNLWTKLEESGNLRGLQPQGDYLVTSTQAGALDAAIVYRSNANASQDKLDAIPIPLPRAIASQPLGIGKDSPHRQTLERLLKRIAAPESRERFRAAGFNWLEHKQ